MINFLQNEYDSHGVVKVHGLRGFYTAPETGKYLVLGEEMDLIKGESVPITLTDEEAKEWLNRPMVEKLSE